MGNMTNTCESLTSETISTDWVKVLKFAQFTGCEPLTHNIHIRFLKNPVTSYCIYPKYFDDMPEQTVQTQRNKKIIPELSTNTPPEQVLWIY